MSEEDDRLVAYEVVIPRLLFVHEEHGVATAFWHLIIECDLRANVLARAKQKAFLSRHGRIPWHAWEGRSIVEMRSAMHAIKDIVETESDETTALENKG